MAATPVWRLRLVLGIIFIAMAVLVGRIVYLQVFDHQFLQGQGDSRTVRVQSIDAHRGMISDRDGEPLAVSTPVVTLWANPRQLPTDPLQLTRLAEALGQRPAALMARIDDNRDREFMYLERRMTPEPARRVLDLDIAGVYGRREYKRYYPAGEVTSQLVGMTNIDDHGQEGLELAYDNYLSGVPGQRRVLQDRKGQLVRDLHLIREARPGGNVTLSISLRLQYLAYRELKATVTEHNADSGTLVMMDAHTGEVLAMVSLPSYNPNNRASVDPAGLRNRALTDAFEPGSVMKPLAMSAGLESGKFAPDTPMDTSPGWMVVDGYTIKDVRNFGQLDMTGVITHSSNIGMTHMALALPDDAIWNVYDSMKLGHPTGLGFPGEASGSLPSPWDWSKAKRATLSYGYGLSLNAVQLASAYTAITNDGVQLPPSLLKLNGAPEGHRVMSAKTAHELIEMMETVITRGGGSRAALEGYRVAGKTGTVRKVGSSGYQEAAYRSNFVGIAPASDPRIITVISIDNPKGSQYYGGLVAAPVFSRVAGNALRLLDVPPDQQSTEESGGS
nr:penicillin-binding protein 2 [Kushneria aurantia]